MSDVLPFRALNADRAQIDLFRELDRFRRLKVQGDNVVPSNGDVPFIGFQKDDAVVDADHSVVSGAFAIHAAAMLLDDRPHGDRLGRSAA